MASCCSADIAHSAPESFVESSSLFTILIAIDIKALIYQVLTRSSSALSVTSGKSPWFIGSACYNHMTSDSTIFSHKFPLSPKNPIIYIADNSHLPVSHIGSISLPHLSIDNIYLVP